MKNQRGFNLIEVMIALFIMMICFAGFTKAYAFCMQNKNTSQARYEAQRVAQTAISPVLANNGDITLLQTELQKFPKTITEGKNTFTVSVSKIVDWNGNAVDITQPVTQSSPLIVYLSVPIKSNVGGTHNTVEPTYVIYF